ncbi:hypothetical protein G7054_g7351 [Neopestalotiopsis clavispora]|nr:hypothetical protein G7054_g7351 [Neopestalotiopsis clavispora]
MRALSSSLAALLLLQLTAAELERRTVQQRHVHRRAFIPKSDRLTVTDASIASPTEQAEVVVYLDQFGNPVYTATETVVHVPTATSSLHGVSSLSAPLGSPAVTAVVAATGLAGGAAAKDTSTPVAQSAPAVPAVSAAYPVSSSSSKGGSSSTTVPDSSTDGSGSTLHGVTYSPYTGTGACKTASQVDADFAVFSSDHGVIRLYGVDCDQVASAYAAAKKYGNKLFLGIFDIDAVDSAVSTMAAGVNNDWSIVDTVSVGNELVNNGAKSPAQVIAAVQQARTALKGLGYQGPVVTVDTFVAAINHPELCDESDYCAVNVHPFFDPNTGADQAGPFVTTQLERIRSKMADSGKRIVVTETGWPWQGEANGAAVPGTATQKQALSSIRGSFTSNPGDCIFFTAFNDLWKKAAPATFMAEQFWGMGGRYSATDQ